MEEIKRDSHTIMTHAPLFGKLFYIFFMIFYFFIFFKKVKKKVQCVIISAMLYKSISYKCTIEF